MTFRSVGWAGVLGMLALTAAPLEARQVGTVLPSGEVVYTPGSGVTNPIVVSRVDPKYTEAARVAGIQGTVELQLIVQADGTVGDIRVTKSLDKVNGLDDQAVAAAGQWKFKPALVAGQPVNVYITLVLSFRVPAQAASTQSSAPSSSQDSFGAGAYSLSEPGLVAPVIVEAPLPRYTVDAMRAKLQGTVVVEVVVNPNGTVGGARVLQSLDTATGLDDEALLAAEKARFVPGTVKGVAVPVLVTVTEDFRLH